MLSIDDHYYSFDDLHHYHQQFDQQDLIEKAKPNSKRIAVCIEDQFTWLALCLYLKDKNLSVMPIHPNTPLVTAQHTAEKALCDILFYDQLSSPIELKTNTNKPSEPGLIQTSSGTTGDPKCINRSWQSIDIELKNYIAAFSRAEHMTPVIACPITHSYGLICGVMSALERKKEPHVVTNINPKYLMKVLQKYEAPLLYSSPTMLKGLMSLWKQNEPLHAAMTSGTMMNESTYRFLSDNIKYLFQQYGCSEAGCISLSQHVEQANDIGIPLPHITVSCSKNENDPSEIIAKTVDNQGERIFYTQDLGYIAAGVDGNEKLHFVARQDDTIIVAGLNVYPQDVEDIILSHPDIIDALIFKIEDPYAGQRVALQYVAKQDIEYRDLKQWLHNTLAAYQRPQEIEKVASIERMANGKVNRKKVAKAFFESKLEKINLSSKQTVVS